ncbi:ROK family protein [Cohnella suwonensis]|uniref:ROK family protein n=1 Tax=Cohnella suwonensis TaxID=696072 RepID=A0ABW0LR71_9BACL
MNVSIGIDVGGTNIVGGVVEESGAVIRKVKRPTEANAGSEAVLDRITDIVRELRESLADGVDATAVGVGIPGLVDPDAGLSRFAGNLGWRNVPVVRELEKRIGLPVVIDNDVKLYVYGEAVAGAGRGSRHVLGITIGTGIAAAIVNDGAIYHGFKSMAGEIGHVRMDGVNERCSCGLAGCLETVASASGMVRQTRKALREGRESVLRDWFPGDEAFAGLTAAHLSRAMDEGDALATAVMTRAGMLNGRALAAAAMTISPEVIVVGGGGALAGDRLMEPLRNELYGLLLPDFREGLKVVLAENNDEAGIIGSALYARKRMMESDGK